MYRNILVPVDGSALSLKAVRAAARLAAPLGARVTALHVMVPFKPVPGEEALVHHISYTVEDYARDMKTHVDRLLKKASSAAGRVKMDTARAMHENPWEGIIKAAKSRKCDLIVMASHGRRGLAGLLLGSETQKVLTHSKTPVLVCR